MANAKKKKPRHKALMLGVGLDSDGHKRLTTGPNFILAGGSEETHEVMTEKAIKINEKLAAKGSPNHRLVLELLNKEARLEGTEHPDLLVEEYDSLSKLLQNSGPKDNPAALAQYRAESNRLMEKRDVFIAERIRSTIQPGETPLVFMGVRHKLEKLLEADFVVAYIIYRLPFRKIGDIYNT